VGIGYNLCFNNSLHPACVGRPWLAVCPPSAYTSAGLALSIHKVGDSLVLEGEMGLGKEVVPQRPDPKRLAPHLHRWCVCVPKVFLSRSRMPLAAGPTPAL